MATKQQDVTRQDELTIRTQYVTPTRVIATGLIAQLAGVGWEGVWHIWLSSRAGDLRLPPNLGFLGDHIISNLGVLGILGGAGWLLVRKRIWRRGAVFAISTGTVLQVIGAAWDLTGHIRGSENSPIAYSLLGLGFILSAGALVASRRKVAQRA